MHLKPYLKFIRKVQNFNTKIQSHKESKMYITILSFTLTIILMNSMFGSLFFYKDFKLQNMFDRKY